MAPICLLSPSLIAIPSAEARINACGATASVSEQPFAALYLSRSAVDLEQGLSIPSLPEFLKMSGSTL
jgi:hypothetical protein